MATTKKATTKKKAPEPNQEAPSPAQLRQMWDALAARGWVYDDDADDDDDDADED